MAIVTRRISDLTGAEAPEQEMAQLVVRQHPKADQPKRLDALPSELETLKEISDLVILEVRLPDGSTREAYVRYTDFSKVVADQVVVDAPGTRGRLPGSRVG